MKGLFPQYDGSRQLDYKSAWSDAVFVFDTNVLLNLYRYQENTRDELLSVLGELSEKIWIPFHVALEFQRNRMKVIAAQGKKFSEIRKTIEKFQGTIAADLGKLDLRKRHTLIDPDHFIQEFEKLTTKFLEKLSDSQKTQQKLTSPDKLKDKIEELFHKRVGPPPKDQKVIDEIFKAAEQRYKFKIPPGYMDSKKDEDSPDEFIHGNIIYKRKYGDYILWMQLLEFSKAQNKTKVVFITDDAKEDWWLKYSLDGPKTIGPRPELIEEAATTGGIETFIMYTPEGFLQYAKDYLHTPISDSTLEDVRDTSKELKNSSIDIDSYMMSLLGKIILFKKLRIIQGGSEIPHTKIDFLVEDPSGTHGYEIRQLPRQEKLFAISIRRAISKLTEILESDDIDTITFVFILDNAGQVNHLLQLLTNSKKNNTPTEIRVSIYVISEDHSNLSLYMDFPYDNLVSENISAEDL